MKLVSRAYTAVSSDSPTNSVRPDVQVIRRGRSNSDLGQASMRVGHGNPREEMVRKALAYFPGLARSLPNLPAPHVHYSMPVTLRALVRFLRESLRSGSTSVFRGYAIGLSGGLDSTVAMALARRAVGRGRLLAVYVSLGRPEHDTQCKLAIRCAEELAVPYLILRQRELLRALERTSQRVGPFSEINSVTRAIHESVFQIAEGLGYAVVSTVDRSEDLLCRHMEYFYGHVAPLAPLYKTEVAALARELGVPATVIEAPPGCSEAWLDAEVLGATYEVIDPLLRLLADERWTPRRIVKQFGGDLNWVERIAHRIAQRDWRMITRSPRLPGRGYSRAPGYYERRRRSEARRLPGAATLKKAGRPRGGGG